MSTAALADPFPPTWGAGTVNEASGPIHFAPAAWPTEPPNPVDCGVSCGQWKPYTRFQGDINDPRVQDPSNGGTAPQNYVNVSSSCIDKSYPSIYYYLYKDPADQTKDVLMFRWRVEQIANNYATGPSAGSYGATDPWSSGLWTVLFDIDGDGYRDVAAHLNGSSGDPSHPIDMIAGIWGNIPTQSIDYLTDPNIKLIAHNPTAFTSGSTILNFQNSLNPTTTWPAGSVTNSWDYGTTRAKLVYSNSCNEYFVDYQIPVRMLDASSAGPNSSLNGPKITRDTPISMLFCTANSLNNPFQKDCSLNRSYIGDASKPGPFGDYLSFNKEAAYAQPIVSSVTATAPTSCSSPSYQLTAKVQDTLYVNSSGVVEPSIKSVKFFYWYDKDSDGTTAGDAGSAWTYAVDGTLKPGTLNTWIASWNASGLLKGRYLIGVQAVDDKTRHDDGVPGAPVDNRTFSYIVGSTVVATQAQIYNNAWSWNGTTKSWVQGASIGWLTGQDTVFPGHAAATMPGVSEDWYGNPDVTGLQVATTGVDLAINACGVAPTIVKAVSSTSVTVGQEVTFSLTVSNPANNPSAVSLTQFQDVLPVGFAYKTGSTTGIFGTSDPIASGQTITWTGSTSINPGASAALSFVAIAPNVTGAYSNTSSATTDFGVIISNPVQIGIGAAQLTIGKTPSTYSSTPGSTITYTITYSNDSPVNATGVTLSDTLPAGLSYVAASCSGSCTYAAGTRTLDWSIGNLASGAGPYSVTFQATVDSPYGAAANNQNTVSINSDQTATATASATVYIDTPRPQLTLNKSASATMVAPGANVTFTLSYANTGNATTNSVVLADPLPSGFTYVSATGSPSSAPGVGSNGTVTWSLGALAAGASGSVTVTAQATNAFTGTENPANNIASISSTEVTTPVSDSASVGVTQSGQVCRTYYMSNQQGNVGTAGTQYLANTIMPSGATTTIAKLADDAANAGIIEIARFYQDPVSGQLVTFDGSSTLAGQLDYIKSTLLGGAANSNSVLYLTVYDYDPTTGATVQIAQNIMADNGAPTPPVSLTGVTPAGSLSKGHRLLIVMGVDMASGKATTIELRANSVNSYVQLCNPPPANLVLEKTVNTTSVSATGTGRTLTYTLNYANTSSVTAATNATIIDTLPAGVTFASATLNGGAITPTGTNPYTFALGTVAASGTGSLVIAANVANDLTGATSLTNSADIASDQTAALTATATTSVTGAVSNPAGTPNVIISKQASKTLLIPGDTVTYMLTVVNAGDKTATSVQVSDTMPAQAYFTYKASSISGGNARNDAVNPLTWTIDSLSPGASATLTFQMTVANDGSAPAGITTQNNTASAIYGGGGTGTATSNTVSVSISTNPNLTLAKSVSPGGARAPGDTLTYTLTVTNNGSGAASGVLVTDPIPANTSYKGSIAASQGSGSFDAVNNQVIFNVGALTAAASATLSFQANVISALPSGSTALTNTATVTASNASIRIASASSTASAAPVMRLSKTGPASVPYPGATLSAAATNATTLFVNSTAAFSVAQYVKVGATIARITAMTGNTLTVSAPITASSGAAVIGSATYLLSYQNTGNADAASVVVSDPLPAGWVFVAASPTETSAPAVGVNGTVSWSVGTVVSGSGGTLQLVAIPTAVGSTTNTATLVDSVYCSGGTPPATCSSSITTTTGGLSMTKATSTPNAVAGGTASWTITVTNSLATAVTGVEVTDILPSGFAYSSTGTIAAIGATRTATVNPVAGDMQPKWGAWTLPGNGSLSIPFTASVGANVGPATYQNEVMLTTTTASAGVTGFDPLATTAEDVTVLASGTGIVNGTVYRDDDANGTFNAAVDTPLAGVAVTIIDSTSTAYVVYTDASGFFSRVVSAGSTIVDVADPAGVVLTTNTSNQGSDPTTVIVPDGGSVTDHTGFVAAPANQGNVNGTVFADTNASGSQDVGESGRIGVTVELLDSAGTVVRTTLSGVTGEYSFASLPPGTYGVRIAVPAGLSSTTANPVTSVSVTANATTIVNFGLGQMPDLTIAKSHAGNFTQSQVGATYSLTVTNIGTVATSGMVSVTDTLPAGFTATAISGTGWSCVLGTLTCTRSDALANGASYPVITLTVDVASNAAATLVNSASVSGGGESNTSNNNVNDSTTITPVGAPSTYSISGTVFNDTDGSGLKNGAEAGTNGGGLNAILVDGSSNVVATNPVAANGTWSFANTANGTYTIRLSTTAGTVGNPAPTAGLPVGWFNTGESAGGVTTDGSADGNLSVTVSGANLTTPTQGIRQRADVIVQKNGPGAVAALGVVIYTVRVYNAGPGSADGTVLADGVPAGVTGMTWACGNAVGGAVCPVASGSGAISQTLASFPSGGSLTYTVTGTAPASGSFTNSATATVPSTIVDPDTTNNTSSVTTQIGTVPVTADLAVAKYGPASVAANGAVSYVIMVSNAGPGAASGAVFADAVAAGLTGVTWACGNAVGGAVCPNASGANAISETIATFPAGSSLSYVVAGTAPGSGSVTNTATISAPGGVTDPDTSNNTSAATTLVAATAGSVDLAISKTGPAIVAASATMTYKIVVSNAGPDAVLGARVVDAIPSALTGVTWICGGGTDGGTCVTASGSGNAIDTSVNLPNGATVTIAVTGIAPATTATFINTARVIPPNGTGDPDPGNNVSGPVITHVTTSVPATVPDVFTLINVPASVAGGGVVNAQITFGNQGASSAAGVSYLITLPAGLGAVSCAGASCSYNPANGVVTVSGLPTSLSSGQSVQLTLSYLAPAGAGVALTVTSTIATTTPGETPSANNTATAATTTTGAGALADPTTWISAPATAYAGNTVVVTAGFANLGGVNATGVSFDLTGLPGTSVVSHNGVTCSWNSGTGAVTGCGLPNTIPIGQSLTLQASYTAPASGPVTVTSTVAASNDANAANNSAMASTTIAALPGTLADVAAAVAAPAKANRSSTVLVPVTFSNLGPAAASGVGYAITLGSGTSNAKVTYNGVLCTYSGGVVSGCGLPGTLNPGQSVGLVLSFTAPSSAGSVPVVATVTTMSTETNAANNVASGTVTISATTGSGAISGRVWYDANHNTHLDAGESGRPGWVVELMQGGAVIAQKTSDANGLYSFTGLDDGVYSVRFLARTGVGATPVNGESGVPVSGGGIPGQSILSNIVIGSGVTAVTQQSLPIDPSGTVYDSATRLPISGAVVTLAYGCGAMDPAWLVGGSANVTTGADGNYAFFLQPAAPSDCNYSLTVSRGGYTFVSTLIPPTGGSWPAGGGSVSGVSGAPASGQNTTYYLTGPKPTADLTNNNIPLDAVVAPPPAPIPTLSEWGMIALSSLLLLFGFVAMRRHAM